MGLLIWSCCNGSSRLDADLSLVPASVYVSMVVEGSTGTVECCLEHEYQTYDLSCLPRGVHLLSPCKVIAEGKS